MVSPDLAAPWVMQLGGRPSAVTHGWRAAGACPDLRTRPALRARPDADRRRAGTAANVHQAGDAAETRPGFLPQQVTMSVRRSPAPSSSIAPASSSISCRPARRAAGVGVGKEGFGWAAREDPQGEWPDWHPPPEMIDAQSAKVASCRFVWMAASRTRSARTPSISAARSTASTAPTRPGRSAPTSRRAASACATRTWSTSTSVSASAPGY